MEIAVQMAGVESGGIRMPSHELEPPLLVVHLCQNCHGIVSGCVERAA